MARLRTGAIVLTNRVIIDNNCHNLFPNGTTLVHEIHKVVGKYIMERCDVDLCDSFNTETRFIELFPYRKCEHPKQRRRTGSTTRRRTATTGSVPPQ